MSAKPHEIADFFRQLELLTRAGLPLPDSLRQLSGEYHHGGLRAVCADLSKATADGQSLSAAMRVHAETFSPFFIRMVEIGEKDGALPEVMGEMAKISRRHYQMASMLREIMLYPAITISSGIFILIGLCYFVFPVFSRIFVDDLKTQSLPTLSKFIFGISGAINIHIIPVLILCAIYLVAVVWLFIASKHSNLAMLRLARYLPYADIFFYNLSMARFCSLWAALTRRKIPEQDTFALLADTADFPPLAAALRRIATRCESGEAPLQCLDDEKDISRLLVMTLKSTPENVRPEQLDKMAEIFYESGDYGFHRVGMTWEFISLIGMVLVVAGVILILFLPYLSKLLFMGC